MKKIYKIDLANEVYNLMKDRTPKITKRMTNEELKAYRFGVTTTLIILSKLLFENKEHILINENNCSTAKEIVLDDFISSVKKG